MEKQTSSGQSPIRIEPYTISVAQTELDDLKTKLQLTRWPDQVDNAEWNYGTNLDYLKELTTYWKTNFDWRKQEDRLNKFSHFLATINGIKIHFIHEKGKGKNPTPIVLLHGWPSSFLQMEKIIPMLTDPLMYGGSVDESFDVVVVSLPGFGFSDKPKEKGMNFYQMAELVNMLMVEGLDYKKFYIRGSDVGAAVATELAISHPDNLTGLHLSGSNPFIFLIPDNLSAAEKDFVEKAQKYVQQEGAYGMEQSTKPQTLAYGLNDSPIGLAAWLLEKFRTWSDSDGDVEKRFTKDQLLTNITLYWLTQTINSSMRVYYESAHTWSPNANRKVEVPTVMFMFQKDIALAPREWASRSYNVQRWTEYPSGGHFAEWEEPQEVAKDIRQFLIK